MDSSNVYRFNGTDPFDNWTIKYGYLLGYYPRNSKVNQLSQLHSVFIKDKTIHIPNTVKVIYGSCFRKVEKYEYIHIPETVLHISDLAFRKCTATLVVIKGSFAEKYAKKKKLKYEVVEMTKRHKSSIVKCLMVEKTMTG